MAYGTGTRSYNRSTEKRTLDKERAEATARFEATPRREIPVLLCECRSFKFAHSPEEHKKLRSDMDWRSWKQRERPNDWRWEAHSHDSGADRSPGELCLDAPLPVGAVYVPAPTQDADTRSIADDRIPTHSLEAE